MALKVRKLLLLDLPVRENCTKENKKATFYRVMPTQVFPRKDLYLTIALRV